MPIPLLRFPIFQGNVYAGVQFSEECFCGDSYGSQGQADESECNMQCKGDATEMCGAANRNSVYETGELYHTRLFLHVNQLNMNVI